MISLKTFIKPELRQEYNKDLRFDISLFILLIVSGYCLFLPNSVGTVVSSFYKILMVVFYIVYIPRNIRNCHRNVSLAIILLFYWVVNFIRVPDVTVFSLIDMLILVFFCTGSASLQRGTYLVFRKVFVVISFFGIIAFIGHVTGVLHPLTIEDFYEDGSSNEYYNYGFSILLVNKLGFLFRLCGLFNEPGMMGTFAALILVAEHFNYRSVGNWIIFVAGICCFSLAFWVILFLSFVFDAVITRRKGSLIIILALGVSYGSLMTISTKSENVNRLFSRVSIDDSGKLAGDQRTSDDFDKYYRQFKENTSDFLLGTRLSDNFKNESSYKRYVVQYGLILFLLIFVSLFCQIMRICKKHKWAYVLTLCFFASIYQRPLVFDLIYFVILIGGIESIIYKDNKEGQLSDNTKRLVIKK